jgi:hypothetical protein
MGERIIIESCLAYLSFDVFGEGCCASVEEYDARLERSPFLKYAACYLGIHKQEYPSDGNDKLALTFLLRD